MATAPVRSAPAADELEVSVFGRGVGEAIVVHLGHGRWLTVDSCLDEELQPASLSYLREIGAKPEESVFLVVASHWDSDHVGGLAQLFQECRNADFSCASTFQKPAIVKTIMRRASEPHEGIVNVDVYADVFRELRRRKRPPAWALRGTVLWEDSDARVWSLAPSGKTHSRSLLKLVENAGRVGDPREERRNYLSIVLWLEVGDHRILLGGDLEKKGGAWGDAAHSPGRRGTQASVLKVPHHGSKSGHDDRCWDDMCVPEPWAAVTAYTRSKLPTSRDRARLRTATPRAFLAGDEQAPATRSDEDQALAESQTAGGEIVTDSGPLGHIRFRAPLARPGAWQEKCFWNAKRL